MISEILRLSVTSIRENITRYVSSNVLNKIIPALSSTEPTI